MLQTLLWRRMTCSSIFLKYPLAVFFKLPLHTFWCLAMHSQRLFLLYVASNLEKMYWDCKLPCIEAEIELSSTFVYDQEMSTSGCSARNSHLSQGGRMTEWCPCLRTDLYRRVVRSKTWLSRKNYPFMAKGVTKLRRCKFIYWQYFFYNFILHCDVIRFTGMGIIVVRATWVRYEFFADLPLVLIM